MSVEITTRIENSPDKHHALEIEHGISFYIEKDDHKILFDTGQSGLFTKNAKQLKIDLTSLQYVVLSHGHFDHSGGLRSLVQMTTDFKLITGQGFFDKKYNYKDNSSKFNGNNFNENFLNEQKITYTCVDKQCTVLAPGIYVITGFPRLHKDEVINPRFKVLRDGSFLPDPFDVEVLLAIDTPEGLVVLLGCSHPGMKNMLDAATNLTNRPVYAILGGTHLIEADANSLAKSMDYLQNNSLQIIAVSHCTGQIATDQLSVANEHYFQNHTGSSLLIP